MGFITALYAGSGVLLALLSLPMIMGRVKPNLIYGFRVPRTLNNPELWYRANKYAGKWMLAAAVIFILTVLGLRLVPGITLDSYALLCTVAIIVPLILGFIFSLRYINRLT